MSSVLGLVPVIGREPLAHRLCPSAPLYAQAVTAVAALGHATVVTGHIPLPQGRWSQSADHDVVELPEGDSTLRSAAANADCVVIHDPLCPLVTSAFIRRVVAAAAGAPAISVRPVIDTVKGTSGGVVTGTVDRETLRIVTSPIVLDPATFAAIPDLSVALRDLGALTHWLRERVSVTLVTAPSPGRRIEDDSAFELMMSMGVVGHQPANPDGKRCR